jgi:hypothetical protein
MSTGYFHMVTISRILLFVRDGGKGFVAGTPAMRRPHGGPALGVVEADITPRALR